MLQGWGWAGDLGRGEPGLGRTLPPASASNLADPHPDPRSSLICLSSKAVKLIRSLAKSPSSNPSPPSGLAGFGSAGLARAQGVARPGTEPLTTTEEQGPAPAGSQPRLQQPPGPSPGPGAA